jgi:formamidopyrimidine-DNA glycosylase
MPELPDIAVYLEALAARILGQQLARVRIGSPFVLRSFKPPIDAVSGKRVVGLRRLGKRIAIGLEDELWLIIHLMIAGRLHWKPPGSKLSGKYQLAAFDFADGTLLLTEAGSKRRAALYLVRGDAALVEHDPGGIDVFSCDKAAFTAALTFENHTLKRALTDPHLLSGIGNAYSDEILHRAGLSPLQLTHKLTGDQIETLLAATRAVLSEWTDRLRQEAAGAFPEGVTAFRPEMAVHGKFKKPCPVCGAPVQRIRFAENETNYCPGCQTGGKILADRSLSRLLKDDWPRHLDDL